MFHYFTVLGGLFLGWGIGGNNAGNVFGTAVGTNSVKYGTAVILIAVFCFAGSVIEGPKLYQGYKFSTEITMEQAVIATFAAAIVIILQTYIAVPTSTTQTSVGAVMGLAILTCGPSGTNWSKLGGWFFCWLILPLLAAVIAFFLMRISGPLINRLVKNIVALNALYRIGLIVFGCYASYTLGANNVVITTGPFFQAGFFGNPSVGAAAVAAATVGGISIAIGGLTYGRKVMATIGKEITSLDPFSALVAVLTHSIVLQLFTELHVPVSSSQAIVGAVAGVGFSKGMRSVNSRLLRSIFVAWVCSPLLSGVLAVVIALLWGLHR